MNRNQKIALGCGGAGCLGLVAVVIVVIGLSLAGYVATPDDSSASRNRNSNDNANKSSNRDSNTNLNANTNSASTASKMSDDDKHKLFQACHAVKDDQLLLKVLARIGYPNASGPGYDEFMEAHIDWTFKNFEFMGTVDTPETGRAYVEAHLDD